MFILVQVLSLDKMQLYSTQVCTRTCNKIWHKKLV